MHSLAPRHQALLLLSHVHKHSRACNEGQQQTTLTMRQMKSQPQPDRFHGERSTQKRSPDICKLQTATADPPSLSAWWEASPQQRKRDRTNIARI